MRAPTDTGASVPPRQVGGRLALVQALRGIAALWVVLFHAAEGKHIEALRNAMPPALFDAIFSAGHYGVAVFFALSGFVIAYSLQGVGHSFAFLGRFVLRRSLRLDPPYWASIAFVVAMAAVSARVKHAPFTPLPPGQIAAHIVYLQELLGVPEIDTVYWTLTYEVQFYIFLATMLVMAHRLTPGRHAATGTAIAWAGMFLLAIASAGGWLAAAPNGLFVLNWHSFFAGVLAFQALRSGPARAGLALLLLTIMVFRPHDGFAVVSGTTALLLYFAATAGWAERGLDWRWLQFLGTISYSLYLLHNPVTGAIGFLADKTIGRGLAASVATLAAIVAASIAAAIAMWWSVERPAHRLSRRISLPKFAPTAGTS